MISVLIVDNHRIVLKGLKILFTELDDFDIETEMDPQQVEQRMQEKEFQVYLIDAGMATKNNLELVSKIKVVQDQAVVILYINDEVDSYYSLLVERKVDGIILKTMPIEQVILTIRLSVQRNLVISTDFLDFINEKMNDRYANLELTHREIQLLEMLIKGYPNKEIAATFNVSMRTAERYLTQLFNLLGVSSRMEAIEVVKERQLINEKQVDSSF